MTGLIRRSPVRTLRVMEHAGRPFSLLDEFESIARKAFDGGRAYHDGLILSLDVYQDEDDLVVKAELPGIDKEDIKVSLEDDVLTIKAEKKREEVAEDATYLRSERYFGEYSRTVQMPFGVDAEKITADYKNGLLEMRLPKAEEAKPRQIEINLK